MNSSSVGGGVTVGGAEVGEVIPKCPIIIPIPSPKQAKIEVTIAILDPDHDIILILVLQNTINFLKVESDNYVLLNIISIEHKLVNCDYK